MAVRVKDPGKEISLVDSPPKRFRFPPYLNWPWPLSFGLLPWLVCVCVYKPRH
jgi:hypothetical protein